MGSVQRSYTVNPDVGFPGMIAEPNSWHRTDRGTIYVPTGGTAPKPGDGVIYDDTNDGFALPTTDAQQHEVIGVLGYRQDQVADADSMVTFANGDEIQITTNGVIWLTAGAAAIYGQVLEFMRGDQRWDGQAQPANFAALYRVVCRSMSFYDVADGNVFKASIGYGGSL